ncbi:MAG: damage-inducible protein D [Gammaproteobacteria bacterium]
MDAFIVEVHDSRRSALKPQHPFAGAPHAIMADFSIQQFEESGRENGIRYWYAHEFMKALGYDSYATFQKVVTHAMGACARLGIDPTEAFSATTITENGQEFRTHKLSRFACFLVSMHADSKKEAVAKAKASLAAIAAQLIEERIQDQDLGRIEAREDLKLAERMMSGAAQSAGIEGTSFAIFKDAGFRGMYNMSLQQLMRRKGVAPRNTLYDFMGLEEMAGNLFRVTQTAARVKNQQLQGLNQLARAAKDVGSEVREIMVRHSGVPPESLPIEENISSVKRRLEATARAMRKLDSPRKKRIEDTRQ